MDEGGDGVWNCTKTAFHVLLHDIAPFLKREVRQAEQLACAVAALFGEPNLLPVSFRAAPDVE